MFERTIAYHCAPAMAGIKPSNLVSCSKSKYPNVHQQIDALNSKLNAEDIYLDIVCECPSRVLLIVYRRANLLAQLRDPAVAAFLESYGYASDGSLEDYLELLSERLDCDKFPHEIGAFLGYPLHDIAGFIRCQGKDCLYVGDWKVYDDLDTAKKTFFRYKVCRKAVLQKVVRGQSLSQIFVAA